MTERIFRGETEVIDFFAGQIAQNGSAELAGLE